VRSSARAVRQKAQKIKLLLLDVDGVLTDGGIYIDNRGVESKRFDVRDGQGIVLLQRFGIEVGFITSRSSKIVSQRAKELGVRIVRQGVHDKLQIYEDIKRSSRLQDGQIAYIGDDIVDMPILAKVGLAVSVRDCWPGVKKLVSYVTRVAAGHGAVREVADLLLRSQKHLQNTI